MSVTFTADIFCDGEDCSEWTHGVTQHDAPPTKTRARRNMRDGFVSVGSKDYCPGCARKLENEQ